MYNQNNQYPQNNQAQGQTDIMGVSGFKIKASKPEAYYKHMVIFTANARPSRQAKKPYMLYQDFMAMMEKAFQESGGNGVRVVIGFNQGTDQKTGAPTFQTSVNIFPNNPNQQFNGGGGGRRQYPQAQRGYNNQPQQGYAPPQQPQQGYAPRPAQQATPQYGTNAPTTQGNTGQAGTGQAAPASASPSDPGYDLGEPAPF